MPVTPPSAAQPTRTVDSEDLFDELQSELGQVQWLGDQLRDAEARHAKRVRMHETTIWARLLAWTQ